MPYQWLKRSRRKLSGGLIKKSASKKKRDMGRYPAETQIGKRKLKIIRTRGGNVKQRLLRDSYANIFDPEEKISKKVKITNVLENRANREYARRRIITKGCIIETEIGNAKVTSRPGQDGQINAVLIEKKAD
ncbi:MAG: 30S ribosomal protein S8e [Candidatus Heimdallarchaeaceae archaeon]|uniref:Small ribosomal subunit protein eS8 n=1 Tax=Candidatus Heimdallarchaeum endolithica TaxID=2876572 RepID=A0A9Y1BT33_9ARCH|nr:MAG: 30S ribosomal protein S8e [Candidatus Heimdallarchaeum endolithica]